MHSATNTVVCSRRYPAWRRCAIGIVSLLCAASAWAQPLVVGRSLPLSGPLQAIGELKRDGGDAYIQTVNRAGGVNGRRIELVTQDDRYVAEDTVTNLKRMAREHQPVAFLGLLRVPATDDHIPLLDELRVPFVGISSATHLLRNRLHRYGFPVRASVLDEGRKLAEHIKVLGVQRVAIVYQDVPLGHTTRRAAAEGLRQSGLTSTDVMLDATGTQVADVVRRTIEAKPQVIVLGVLTQAAADLLTELKKQSFSGNLYTFSSTDAVVLHRLIGDKAVGMAISQIVPMPEGARVKVVAEYVRDVKALGRGRPSLLDRLTHHCHIVETGNESWRFRHSSTSAARSTTTSKRKKGAQTESPDKDLSTEPAAVR